MFISNTQDVIDSRDIIAQIEEFEMMLEDGELDSEEQMELSILKTLAKDASASPDWLYGEQLIHENFFAEYTKEFCKEVRYIPEDLPWWVEIDWEATAEHLKMDYFTVDFDGEIYFIRA